MDYILKVNKMPEESTYIAAIMGIFQT